MLSVLIDGLRDICAREQRRMTGSLTALPEPGSLHRADTPRSLTARERKLDIILDEWPRLNVTLLTGQGHDDSDSAGVFGMPAIFTETCEELDRSLERMRVLATLDISSPAYVRSYQHLRAWYFTCEKRTVLPKKKTWNRYTRGAREPMESQPNPTVRVVRHAHPGYVLVAVAWLALEFVGEPKIPWEEKGKVTA